MEGIFAMEKPYVWTAIGKTSSLAIASAVLAMASILLFVLVEAGLHERQYIPERSNFIRTYSLYVFLFVSPLLEIAAVFCGHVARRSIKRSSGALSGRGWANAGLLLGYAGICKSILLGSFFYLLSRMNFGQ
jgi:magnesium-transporting ATPase (P-type)